MAKTRVSELAKQYGITSKDALEKLSAIGEFAKTASSSIELPAVKKFEATYGAELGAGAAP
ncbi:MAG: translation initiation factor IF-2 N-terminal domain-containing protein, partial [Nocardioides sp.]